MKEPVVANRLPMFRAPQLATLVSDVPDGAGWIFEMKYDGYRCLAAINGDAVRLFTRSGKDWSTQFAAMMKPMSRITTGTALIDGELCALDAAGRADFATLRRALSAGSAPLVYFAFDLLELNGKDLSSLPLIERKARLATLLGKRRRTDPIQYSAHVVGHGQKVYLEVCALGGEGIIAKRAEAPYRGVRSRSWLKVKCAKRQDFVIGGWSPSPRKKTFASLLVGTWVEGALEYRGRVGTGFTVDQAEVLQRKLEARSRKTSPFTGVPAAIARGARWVTPELVAEVGYAEYTPDGLLRHPAFLGLGGKTSSREVVLEVAESSRSSSASALDTDQAVAAAQGAGIQVSSPERVVYPRHATRKIDLIAYYVAVAERMLPYVAKRPLSLLRCPKGQAKTCFFQKHDSGGFPKAMRTVAIAAKDGREGNYFYVDGLGGLIAGTQMNVMEWHLWGSRINNVEKPERIIFDIDPDDSVSFSEVRAAAVDIAKALAVLGLQSFPLVTGGKGIHVIAPLVPRTEWPVVKEFCRAFAHHLANGEPKRFVATMSKAKRKGKLFIDYLRNERGATAIAPWSGRARASAAVALPVSWDELRSIASADAVSFGEAAERAHGGDPWPEYFSIKQTLTAAKIRVLEAALSGP